MARALATSPPAKSELIRLYRRRADWYDLTANLYYLVGFREWAYRRRAVAALALSPGDTVIELGCGTGLNFSLLERMVGPEGRIVGVDLTTAMLGRARARIERAGWRNVELVQADMGRYRFPRSPRAVLSTFALTLVPEYDGVIRRAAGALAPGGRLVVLDLKRPNWAPDWLVRLGVWLTAPFGVKAAYVARHPWESMRRHLARVTTTELFGGFAYIAMGEKPSRERRHTHDT
jgi:demethylmenaquinone methyltransferase/2-methoxy-6-polyprenyl-1,4-benzoquinol methylase